MKKKKILSGILAAALVLGTAAALPQSAQLFSKTASAEGVQTEGDYRYTVNKDGETVTLEDYIGTDSEVVIPSILGGKPVTAIEDLAFDNCKSLVSVTIPERVTDIGEDIFSNCSSLETIKVDENNAKYTSIDGVLFNKDKTTLICYPDAKKGEFYQIPDGVTWVCSYAFAYCRSLTSITIPDSVTGIGDWAFAGCRSLTNVTIPDNVAKIGKMAFAFCISLTRITIPDSVTKIGGGVFNYCDSLETIVIGENNARYTFIDGVLFDKEWSWLVSCPGWKGSYTIPDGVKYIDDYAFYYCESLTSVTIPDGVTGMGDMAFCYCTSLKSVTIPKSIIEILIRDFEGCPIESVTFAGTKDEWRSIPFNTLSYSNASIICTDGIIDGPKPITSEPATSEPATSDPAASEPAASEPTTSVPTESTVTPGETDPASEPDSGTDEQTVLEATLKNVDSENGIEGEALDKLLFGDSGWIWDQVEKIEFSSDNLFSVQYKNDNGDWVKLGDEPTARAAADGEWNTAWTLDPSEMGKDKYAKVISKDGIIDVTAKIYIKSGAEKPSGENSGTDQQPTGIVLAIAPAILAANAAVVVLKKKK